MKEEILLKKNRESTIRGEKISSKTVKLNENKGLRGSRCNKLIHLSNLSIRNVKTLKTNRDQCARVNSYYYLIYGLLSSVMPNEIPCQILVPKQPLSYFSLCFWLYILCS